MRALIDTCIVVDFLQNREPFSKDAQSVFWLSANRIFDGFLTAKAVTDIYYLTHRVTHDDRATREILTKLCTLFDLLDTTALDMRKALSSKTTDFEDAVMIESAIASGIDAIVARNAKDYSKAPIPVYSPKDFITLVTQTIKTQ